MTADTAGDALLIRPSRDEDLPAITRIYGHWVTHGLASFELEPPGVAEMQQRRRSLVDQSYPYLVAVDRGTQAVLGYAYAGPYRTRPAYRHTVENSVYVAPEVARRGVAAALMAALIEQCERLEFRLIVAVIGDSANAPSIRLHERFGFAHAGLLPACGWKHGRWVDSVLMTRALGAGAGAPPSRP